MIKLSRVSTDSIEKILKEAQAFSEGKVSKIDGDVFAANLFFENSTRTKTSFEKGIDDVSKLLIRFMAFMFPIVFIVNWLTKGSWLDALLFALAVAVGLTPEIFPMIITTNLRDYHRGIQQNTLISGLVILVQVI